MQLGVEFDFLLGFIFSYSLRIFSFCDLCPYILSSIDAGLHITMFLLRHSICILMNAFI